MKTTKSTRPMKNGTILLIAIISIVMAITCCSFAYANENYTLVPNQTTVPTTGTTTPTTGTTTPTTGTTTPTTGTTTPTMGTTTPTMGTTTPTTGTTTPTTPPTTDGTTGTTTPVSKTITGYKWYSGALRHKVLFSDGTYEMEDCGAHECVCGRIYN